jgi:RHS repeat-associated protein
MVTAIADNQFPGNTNPFTYAQQSQNFTYTSTRRLASAKGYYGTLGWTYDANGNRATETTNGVTSTYAYPAGSNRLTSVTPSGGSARSLTYDAAGNFATDSRTGSLGMTYQFDPEGRLSKVYQTNATANGATYLYDANSRLSQRIVTQTVAPTSTTTVYVHDLNDHIIAELNAAGQTQREYIWLNDMPIAVVDGVATGSPVIYFVHVDHLMRPARMTAANTNWVWDVIYAPFGAVSYIWTNPETLDMRFPGQWFQLESGLAYNWHRHYDATLGRYVQPDPLLKDAGKMTLAGLPDDGASASSSFAGRLAAEIASSISQTNLGIEVGSAMPTALFADGPRLYSYANVNPLARIDWQGLDPITGFTKHGINQMINRGISPAAICDAVNNPIKVQIRENGTIRYYGSSAVIVLNPLGQVVTGWGQ